MADFTTGGAKAQDADVFIGKKFGKYEVKEKLGQGAMGIVLKVWDTLEDVYKAIKMVPPEVAFDELSFDQLKQEVNSSSKVVHPNVIKVMGLEEYQGLYFIVMEYVDGVTLSKKMLSFNERKLPEKDVLEYLKQACEGLREAHRQNVIHLDLKPQNIMLTKDSRIKILDFSISYQITKSMTMLTGKNMSTGTLPYMAPEQLSKKYGKINEQTDVWGIAATMYHLLSGDVPFEDRNQILDSEEEPYELEDVSDLTKSIINGCMQKNRAKRFKNIAELMKAAGFTMGDSQTPEILIDKPKRSKEEQSDKKGDLAITTNVDCDVMVNNKKSVTKDKYLFIKDLPYGEADIKAETDLFETKQNILIEKQLTKLELSLEKKKVSLYAKSMIGDYKLSINGNTYKCPELIENLPAGKYDIKIEYRDRPLKDNLELINSTEFEYELTEDRLNKLLLKYESSELKKINNLPETNIDELKNKIVLYENLAGIIKNIKFSKDDYIKELNNKIQEFRQAEFSSITNLSEIGMQNKRKKLELLNQFKESTDDFNEEADEEIAKLEIKINNEKEKIREKNEIQRKKRNKTKYISLMVIILIALMSFITYKIFDKSLSESQVKSMLKSKGFYSKQYYWNKNFCNPNGNFINDYESKTLSGDKVVLDKSTSLMWHQSGSSNSMTLSKAKEWVRLLNSSGYAGYSDWRLPTLEEAASLLESGKSSNGLYIDSKFSKKQLWIWTSNMFGSGRAWYVRFTYGSVYRSSVGNVGYVRPVRLWQ